MCKSVVTAISGGVDSSVAALLLKEQGFKTAGITLKLFDQKKYYPNLDTSDLSDDISDAKSVAVKLNIHHHVFDLLEDFEKSVIEYFVNTYLSGATPNPCIVCNKTIKFHKLFEKAFSLAFDMVATGHYCRLEKDEQSGRFLLRKAVDHSKDQSYVLYSLSQEQLCRTLFPLGNYTKAQIRSLAEQNGLITAHKSDSQDICFIKDGNYRKFLESYTGKVFPKGDFILKDNTVVGTHNGLPFYTPGQRKGLGVSYYEPLYVVSKDIQNNKILLGKEKDLYSSRVIVKDVNFVSIDKPCSSIRVTAKLRYKQQESPAILHPMQDYCILEFDTPQRAVTSGQSAVFYDGEYVIGGGIIQ